MPYMAYEPTTLSVIEPAAVPPMVLLLTVCLVPIGPVTRMPRKPMVVPLPPLLIVIDPMLLLETRSEGAELKSRMPMTGAAPDVVEVAL